MSRQQLSERLCAIESCGRKHYAKDLCRTHYMRTLGDCSIALDAPIIRQNPGQWGSWYLTAHGYVQRMRRVPSPDGGRGLKERQYQHHVVWEEEHGPLLPGQNIHHRNGDRADNRLENLELWDTSQPAGQRPEDKLAYAREIFERYAPVGDVWIQPRSNEIITVESATQ